MLGFWLDQSRQRKAVGYERKWTYLVALVLKNPAPNTGDGRDVVWFLGQEDPLEKGMSTHSKYSYLENTMDWGPQWAIVHRVTKSWTRPKWLSTHKKEIELGKTHRIWWDKDLLSGKQRREVSKRFLSLGLNHWNRNHCKPWQIDDIFSFLFNGQSGEIMRLVLDLLT